MTVAHSVRLCLFEHHSSSIISFSAQEKLDCSVAHSSLIVLLSTLSIIHHPLYPSPPRKKLDCSVAHSSLIVLLSTLSIIHHPLYPSPPRKKLDCSVAHSSLIVLLPTTFSLRYPLRTTAKVMVIAILMPMV